MAKEVSQVLGSCRVKCSSTIASRGENNRNALSIATALDGNTTMFLQTKKKKNRLRSDYMLPMEDSLQLMSPEVPNFLLFFLLEIFRKLFSGPEFRFFWNCKKSVKEKHKKRIVLHLA